MSQRIWMITFIYFIIITTYCGMGNISNWLNFNWQDQRAVRETRLRLYFLFFSPARQHTHSKFKTQTWRKPTSLPFTLMPDPSLGENGSDDTTYLQRRVTGNRYMYSFPPSKLSKVTVYDKAFFTVDLKDLTGFFSRCKLFFHFWTGRSWSVN